MTDKTTEWGGSAFPVSNGEETDFGMHLRDHFAAHAPDAPSWWMAVIEDEIRAAKPGYQAPDIAWLEFADGAIKRRLEKMAQWRWAYADAMLAERGA